MSKVTITVEGDIGCGKSYILNRIRHILIEEFNADVNSDCLKTEYFTEGKLADFEKDQIKDTYWVLQEKIKRTIPADLSLRLSVEDKINLKMGMVTLDELYIKYYSDEPTRG